MKIALIANPNCGGRNHLPVLQFLENRLKSRGIRAEIHVTRRPGHAERIAGRLAVERLDAVAVAGGDGTNCQVLNGLLKSGGENGLPPIGILPLGRGNSFALDLPIRSIDEGIDALAGGRTRPVDVCRYTTGGTVHYFVNLLGAGFVTDVARTAARFGRLGDFSYVVGVFHRVMELRFHRMKLTVDGTVIDGRNCFVEICNSRYTGGNMLMAPEARIDDGRFDVMVAGPLGRFDLLRTFPKIFKGTHGEHPAVRFIRGRRATLETEPVKTLLPDGEIAGSTPTTVDVLPGRVRYFCLEAPPLIP